jgi:S-adenosyl-L-methionine hydrolase (adenosine-forming)
MMCQIKRDSLEIRPTPGRLYVTGDDGDAARLKTSLYRLLASITRDTNLVNAFRDATITVGRKGKFMDRTIALLTDFGSTDTYVGVMKAVMTRIYPAARFIDLTHEIPPQQVQQAAFTLLKTYRYFPPGTIFLVVVDPGVGSARRAIAAQAGDYYFVAPDNGVLSYLLDEIDNPMVVELSNVAYQLTPVSNTFHGRDIFAPAAAHLAAGVPISAFGAPMEHITQQLTLPLKIEDKQISGQIISADHFGNLITSIGEFHWSADYLELTPRFGKPLEQPIRFPADKATIIVDQHTLTGVQRIYGETKPGDLMALVGSGGYLEIAINQGSAAKHLNLASGATVVLHIG